MPIDDERRRFYKTKATARSQPQASVATEGELGSKGRVQESLQRLQEMLRSQRGEQASLLAGEGGRIEAHKRKAQHARNGQNDKYEGLQQAFEQMKKEEEEEEVEAARERLRRVQGANPSQSYPSLQWHCMVWPVH
jgi:hypothetical protein